MEEEKSILYQCGRYVVIIIDNHVAENGQVMPAYAIYNTQTDVIEFETRLLWQAVQWAQRCENLLVTVAAKKPEQQKDELTWPEDGGDDNNGPNKNKLN